MEPIKRSTKKEFYGELGFSKSTYQRRSKEINFIIPRGLTTIEIQEQYKKRLKENEEECINKSKDDTISAKSDPPEEVKEKESINENKDEPK